MVRLTIVIDMRFVSEQQHLGCAVGTATHGGLSVGQGPEAVSGWLCGWLVCWARVWAGDIVRQLVWAVLVVGNVVCAVTLAAGDGPPCAWSQVEGCPMFSATVSV